MQTVLSWVGAGLLLIWFFLNMVQVLRKLWASVPHRPSHHQEVLSRLSEVVVAINQNTARGEQLLVQSVECWKNFSNPGPTLDAILKAINELRESHSPSGGIVNDISNALAHCEKLLERISNKEDLIEANTRPVTGPNADLQGIIARLDELQLFLSKQDHAKMQAMDALVIDFSKFAKAQQAFMNAMFNGGSLSSIDDTDAVNIERAQVLVRRYGLSMDEALDRVRKTSVYQPSDGGMGGQA